MAVKRNKEGTWDFHCDEKWGCGDGEGPFRTLQWPTKALAEARGAEHAEEHKSGKPMTELVEFRKKHKMEA